jgi:hypothetical protein
MISVALLSKYLPAVISSSYLDIAGRGIAGIWIKCKSGCCNPCCCACGFNIGLFDETIITGTIMMIAVTCLVGSIVSERSGRRVALREQQAEFDPEISLHRIMIQYSTGRSQSAT